MTELAGPSSQPTSSRVDRAERVKPAAWPRRTLIVLIVLLALVVIIRVVLDPIAAHFTRKALREAKGIRGDFKSVHVSVLPPGYEINQLALIEVPGGSWKSPLLRADRVSVGVDWRRLLHAQISARMRVEEPKIIVTKREKAPEKPQAKKPEIPDVDAQLRQIMPARVDRIEVVRGDFTFHDLTAPRQPELRLRRIEVAAENLATRPGLGRGQPATVSMSGVLGDSGVMSAFVSANPFAKELEFAGNAELRGWKLAELYDFEQPATKLQTPQGTLDLFAEFRAKNGSISGGVKPVLKNVEVRPTEDTLGNKLKAWVADTALDLFSDRVPGRNAVATVVPIQGRLDDPKLQVWPTILSVVRNAFVEGIASGFSNLPPPVSNKEEGVLTQAKNALDEDKGPAKAQPEGQHK
jgi:hypothetical protein